MKEWFTNLKYKTDLVFILVFAALAGTAPTDVWVSHYILVIWMIIFFRDLKLHIDEKEK